jgi:hypothetical protein
MDFLTVDMLEQEARKENRRLQQDFAKRLQSKK